MLVLIIGDLMDHC